MFRPDWPSVGIANQRHEEGVIGNGEVGNRKRSYSVHGVINGACKGVNFVRDVWRNLYCFIPTKCLHIRWRMQSVTS